MSLRLQTIISLATTLFLVGCGGGSGDNSPTSNPTIDKNLSFSGVAVDGYISGATVCLDTNANGKCDSGEPTTQTSTDGTFSFSNVDANKTSLLLVIVSGGTDMATGDSFSGELKNIVDSNSIETDKPLSVSPLTDLSATLYLQDTIKDAQALTSAKQKVANSYGLTVDEVNADPMKSSKVFAKAMEIQQTKALIKATLPQSTTMTDDAINRAVTNAVARQISTSDNVDTTQILTTLEATLNVTIAENKKTFVETQAQTRKTTLDELATQPTTDSTTLQDFQKELEKSQKESVNKLENATDGTDIAQTTTDSADTTVVDKSKAEPAQPKIVRPVAQEPVYVQPTYVQPQEVQPAQTEDSTTDSTLEQPHEVPTLHQSSHSSVTAPPATPTL